MLPPDRNWSGMGAATEQALSRLKKACPVQLPAEYFAFLSFSNGGEGPLGIEPGYIVVNSAEQAADEAENGVFEEFFPGFFVFGGNGAGEAFAFDCREEAQCGLVMFDMTNIDLTESVVALADDFATLLCHIGVE